MSRRLFPLVLTVLLAAGPALAEGGKGKDGDKGPPAAGREHKAKGGGKAGDRAEDRLVGALISAAERSLIQSYYGGDAVRAEALPPGIAKNVARGKPLPPGIAKNLPNDLQTRLRPPPGHVYGVVGSDVVLMDAASRVVVEVLRDVLR